ncbi:hypothetical protein HYV43_04660 [Candidatus Micrarchaeota archaeon]|nr:hypothetical protein [Candidatus Micrarchaeota archaeon]
MRNRLHAPFLALFSTLFFASLLSATCPFLDVSGLFMANVTQGGQAAFPLTLTNLGFSNQLIQLSGTCPDGLTCSFSPSSQDVLVPSQTKTFTLVVDANRAGNHSFQLHLSAENNACQTLDYNLAVNSASNAAMPAFIVQVFPEGNASARPGQAASYQVTIRNNQASLGYARLKVVSPLRSTTDLEAVDVDIPARSEKTVTVKVNVPAGTPRGTYELLFTVDAFDGSGCCEFSYAVRRPLFVFSDKLQLTLQNEPLSCLLVRHKEKTDYVFRLRNGGEIAGPFDFELVGGQAIADASRLDATRLEIAPGDAQQLTWTIQPPSSMVLDKYSAILRAKYLDWVIFEKPVCFVVNAQRSFVLFAPDSYTLTRAEAGEINFTVRNNGTAVSIYTVSATPPSGFDFRVPEASFTLSPGQAKTVRVLVSTTRLTPLGERKLPIEVSDGRIRQSLNTYVNVVSSLQPGKSFLKIELASPAVYGGVPYNGRIGVTNQDARTQQNVTIRIDGLPSNWYRIQTESQNIVATKTAYYDVLFTVPVETRSQSVPFQVTAQSAQGERTKATLALKVTEAPSHLDVAVTNVQRSGDNLAFTVVVYNNGLKPLSGVDVSAGGNTQSVGTLAPGEQRVLAFQALAVQPLVVQARAADGTSSRGVGVPDVQPNRLEINGLLLILVVLMLILVAVAFMLRKESLEKFTESTAKT